MSEDTFVYDGVEVKKTGRSATKTATSRFSEDSADRRTPKSVTLVEITPVDSFHGEWKKWVRDLELFIVQK